jgi:hypothetical protein
MNLIQKLRELQRDITDSGDGLKIVDAWATVARLLPRATTEQDEARRVIAEQDGNGLSALLDRIEHPASAASEGDATTATAKEMKDAMHAFRKRLKLARLNDESKLGGRYTSGGRKSQIDAVEAPREFPTRVWKALVRAGKLRDAGSGFYADAEEPNRMA